MACTIRYLGVVGLLAAGGCTGLNPWFLIETDEETGATESAGTLGETTTTATPTTADATSERTTSDATSDEPTTADASSEPGTISATDPSASDSLPMTATSETGGSFCGDGIKDAGEDCDDGQANGVDSDCTQDCVVTVCGDHYKGPSEECDLGQDNADDGACTLACELPEAVCGDGVTNGAEVCDDGPLNGKMLEKCSADCTTMIPKATLMIKLSAETTIGKFSGNNMTGIFAGDFLCGEGFEVMAASPMNRIASTGAFDGVGQDGWVLEKYRGYTDSQGVLVGITGAEGLLGVINGQPVNLMAPIGTGKVWTGLKPTWQTAEETCNGWVSPLNVDMGVVGDASSVTGSFLGSIKQACNLTAKLYCVEQLP
jgi:hypothetical protein